MKDWLREGAVEMRTKVGLAEMLKGGVIMDVTNQEQAKIAEDVVDATKADSPEKRKEDAAESTASSSSSKASSSSNKKKRKASSSKPAGSAKLLTAFFKKAKTT